MEKIILASKIDLSNQGLSEVPPFIYKCKNLKVLNLKGNQIKEIPKELTKLTQLKNLDLSNNKISQVYAKTFNLQNLVILNLSNNQIKSIPKQIGALTKLTKLFLAGNLIEKLPKEVEHLANLKVLNISNNQFMSFPNSILKLSDLTHLWIGKNKLHEIPTDKITCCLAKLKAFYCQDSMHNVHNYKSLELLTKQKGNTINAIKLMEYKESSPKTSGAMNQKLPPKIFISYSHTDKKYKDEIETTFNALKYTLPNLEFEWWADTKIRSGEDWLKEIEKALNTSRLAIFIISRHFLASEFIMKKEVPTILENAATKGVIILNLVAGHCIFKKSILGKYQAINAPNKPLKSLSENEQELMYLKLSEEVEKYLT